MKVQDILALRIVTEDWPLWVNLVKLPRKLGSMKKLLLRRIIYDRIDKSKFKEN